MWQRIWALVVKEFLAIWKDKRSRAVLIGPPLIQVIVFGYAATFDLNHVALAVYDEDNSAASRELEAAFTGSPVFRKVADLRNEGQVAAMIDARKSALVLHIGPQFSRDLLVKRPARVQLIVDGRDSNTALIILNYARNIVLSFNRQWARDHNLALPDARLEVRAWFNPNLSSRWFVVPGIIALLTMVVSLMVTALSVARERELGTFDQLMVTPLRPLEVVMGKTLPAVIIGLVEASIIILAAVGWFHIPFLGNVATLYLGVLLYLLSAIGVGLMISSLVSTQQQAMLGAFVFLVPSVILSGFATPIANMPMAVQYITYLNPMRYFLVVVRGIFLEDARLDTLWHEFWPMALIGVVTLAAAGVMFRHRLE